MKHGYMMDLLGQNELQVRSLLPDGEYIPTWIERDFSTCQLTGVLIGGCASGAYMPAVEFHTAARTMADHGADVEEYLAELGASDNCWTKLGNSWHDRAIAMVSYAVEAWCGRYAESIAEVILAKQERLEEARAYTEEELEGMDTINQGHSANLKVDEDGVRVWLSRCGPEDGETMPIQIEVFDGDRWEDVT